MSLDKLRNCPRCGELFVYHHKDICMRCIQKVEQEFELCARFLRSKENRQSTMAEMSEKTGVSINQITEFIREKRLLVDHAPNLGFPCESCGTMIRTGRLCEGCAKTWKKTLKEMEALKDRSEPEQAKRTGAYYIDHRK